MSSRSRRSLGPALVAATILTLLALAPIAEAGRATTRPGGRTDITVVITGRGIAVSGGASAPRGTLIVFHITNRSKSNVKLSLLGKTSKLAPSQGGAVALFADRRGAFPIVASLSLHRPLRQTFVVY